MRTSCPPAGRPVRPAVHPVLRLLLLLSAGAGGASAQDPALDGFERGTLGGNWTRFGGSNAEIVNGRDLGVPVSATWLFVGWTASAFDADQFCEVTIADAKPDPFLTQVYVRRRASDLARYGFHFNDENADGTGIGNPRWEIKYDGVPSAQTRILASAPATRVAPGDRLRLEVRGTSPVVLRGFHNEREVISAADNAHQRITTAGPAGMVSRLRRGGFTAPANSPVFASWRGGSLGPELALAWTNPAGNGNSLAVRFETTTNKTYTIQWTDRLVPAAWNTLTTLPGDGMPKSLSLTNTAWQRFYRVRVN